LINEVYPVKLKYYTKTDFLKIGLDYTTREEKVNKNGEKYLGYYKPKNEKDRRKKKTEELANRGKKRVSNFLGLFLHLLQLLGLIIRSKQ
jgi:hypothetical protein